jgi:enoyl-CoA hydratase/carnithine racemase
MTLDIRREDGYQVWTMAFPPVNAISPPFLDAMDEALAGALADESTAGVVLTSGLRVFNAGADAAWIGSVVKQHGPEALLEEFNRSMNRLRRLCLQIRGSGLLVVAALNGHTLAGGLELAGACDLRFSSDVEKIKIGVSEMKLFGVLPSGGGGTQFLSRLMGPSRAFEFILESEPCSPQRALELGLVERIYPADALLAETEAFVGKMAQRAGRIGINAAKRAILDASDLTLADAMALDHAVHWDCMRRGGFLPGVRAFVEQFG